MRERHNGIEVFKYGLTSVLASNLDILLLSPLNSVKDRYYSQSHVAVLTGLSNQRLDGAANDQIGNSLN